MILSLAKWFSKKQEAPIHLQRGQRGEVAAKKHLQKLGLKFLLANYKSARGEIDLVFRDRDCLVFVEVKTRSSEDWMRPAAAVNQKKKTSLTRCAFDYLRELRNPAIKHRFDIVEVVLQADVVVEIRHLPNSFTLTKPYRYG